MQKIMCVGLGRERIRSQIWDGNQLLEASTAMVSDMEPTPTDPDSPYRLVFGATGVLAEVPFALEEPHGPTDDPTAGLPPQEEDATGTPLFFHAIAPWPDNAEWVDLYVGEERLAHFEPSAQAPEVNLTRPNGGGDFGAYDEVPVTWDADDNWTAYRDGNEQNTAQDIAGTWDEALTEMYLGSNLSAPANIWHGWLADCVLWDRVLTSDEIAALSVL